ncbi:MAG: sulfur oxidation c-type cytochrome SoxX [Usitatibacteraceae bacterium]
MINVAVRRPWLPLVTVGLLTCSVAAAAQSTPAAIEDGISQPLGGLVGDAARGKAIVSNRQQGLCVLCHQLPESIGVPLAFQGNLAPSIAGAGGRWSAAQLRSRIVDSRKLNPTSVMPAYHRTEGLTRVGTAWQQKPILDAQQVEDVVAYLVTLK